jgi:predicted nucleotidyltransferase
MPAEDDPFVEVLRQTVDVMAGSGVRALAIGDVADAILRRTKHRPASIELFLLPQHAERAFEDLRARGYRPRGGDRRWRFGLSRSGVEVDLTHRSAGDVYVDDEMLRRSTDYHYQGVSVPVASPEDLLVVRALRHGEDRPREWWDALAGLERGGLDWAYLADRGRQYGAHRVLSLLMHARSLGHPVPDDAIRGLFEFLDERRQG